VTDDYHSIVFRFDTITSLQESFGSLHPHDLENYVLKIRFYKSFHNAGVAKVMLCNEPLIHIDSLWQDLDYPYTLPVTESYLNNLQPCFAQKKKGNPMELKIVHERQKSPPGPAEAPAEVSAEAPAEEEMHTRRYAARMSEQAFRLIGVSLCTFRDEYGRR
jgi:hypothetical protein